MNLRDHLSKRFAVLVELQPMRHSVDRRPAHETLPRLSRILEKVEYLQSLGSVDMVTVTESEHPQYSHTSLETARILRGATSLDVIPHLTIRNRVKSQTWRLAQRCRSLGLDNVLIIRGDNFIPRADHQGYRSPAELIGHLSEVAPYLSVGAACNPHAPREHELVSVLAKIGAGAHYLISQPVFSVEQYTAYVRWLKENGIKIPVIAGIMPFKSERTLSFVESNIREITVPADVRELHRSAEDMHILCVEFNRNLLAGLQRKGAAGIDIFCRGDVELVAQILAGKKQPRLEEPALAKQTISP